MGSGQWLRGAMRALFTLTMVASLAAPLAVTAQDATPAPVDATQWSVNGVSESRFMQRSGNVAYPSPDGRYVAFASASSLCLDDIQAATELRCADLGAHGIAAIDEYGAAWAPGGETLYFTERWAGGSPLGLESDLWQWDPFAGTLTNLSDDSLSGPIGPLLANAESAQTLTIDARPAPIADGSGVIVSRSTWSGGAWTTNLVRLPDATPVAQIGSGEALVIPDAIVALSADEAIVGIPAGDGLEPGLWRFGSSEPEQVIAAEPGTRVVPLSASPDGQSVLIVTLNPAAAAAQGQVAYTVLDLESGEQTDLLGPATRDLPGGGPRGAALSPDGEWAALAWSTTSDGPVDLSIVNVETGESAVVVEDVPAAGDAFTGRGAWWNEDGSIALVSGDGAVARVTLAVEAAPSPTVEPTGTPTPLPTNTPIPEPTTTPTPEPTSTPTVEPTIELTSSPTPEPTSSPTPEPTSTPTVEPTSSLTPEPTSSPTPEPTSTPTPEPTSSPTPEPTSSPTPEPTSTPTAEPTQTPEPSPTPEPSATPTPEPTQTPTPTATPTLVAMPTSQPSTPTEEATPIASPVIEATPEPEEATPDASETEEAEAVALPDGLEMESGEFKPFPDAEPGLIVASPDGRQVAIVSPDHLCVYRVTTGLRRACVDVEGSNIVAIDPDSVTWSPDSKYVAFSEAFTADNDASVESDIWRFDPDEEDVVDLTADQLVGPIGDLLAGGSSFNADTSPAWSTDGGQIYYVRSIWNGTAWTTVLNGMNADGSGSFQVVKVDDGAAGAVPSGTLVAPGDGTVIFTRDRGAAANAGNGIWRVSIAGSAIDQVFVPPAGATTVPRLAEVAPDGTSILVLIPAGSADGTPVPTYGLVDQQTSVLKLIVRSGSDDAPAGRTVAATYAPDGQSIVYVWESEPGGTRDVIRRSLIHGGEVVIASGVPASAASIDGAGVSWDEGGPLVVAAGNGEPAVLRIPANDVPQPPDPS